jgi:hypothetical protein
MTPLGAMPAVAGCGSRTSKSSAENTKDTTPNNLAWIQTNQPIYVAIQSRGVFRLNLNSIMLQPIGIHRGFVFDDFKISPSGRYLIYQISTIKDQSSYIYDLDRSIEQQIFGLPSFSHIVAATNDKWLAAIPRRGEPPVVYFLNLNDGKLKKFAVPSADKNDVLFGSEWSTESSLLFGIRQKGKEVFWRLSPETEKLLRVSGVRTAPAKFAYFIGSKEIETVCEWCSTQHGLSTASVTGGTVSATR